MRTEISFYRETKMPVLSKRAKGALYFIKNNAGTVDLYLTDNSRKILQVGNTEFVNNLINLGGGGLAITSYRSSFDDGKVYSGYLANGVPVILRVEDNVKEYAQGVTNLETDWTNRLNLTYL